MLRSLRCCLNPKVIGGLVAAGLALWLAAPVAGAAALPILVTLVCPLSMGVMMWRMKRDDGRAATGGTTSAAAEDVDVDVDEDLRQAREELATARARQ